MRRHISQKRDPSRSRVLLDAHPDVGPIVVSPLEPRFRQGAGDRLERLFEERCNDIQAARHLAVDVGGDVVTYDQLNRRANRLARYLSICGARPGDRIALLFERAGDAYTAMLAVLKLNATYVPLEVNGAADRMAYIINDADATIVLTSARLRDSVPDVIAPVIWLPLGDPLLGKEDDSRLGEQERGREPNHLACIIYPTGFGGRPLGVAIEHSSLCSFARVAAEAYGIDPQDCVYQGANIDQEQSLEEIWVAWAAGASLVPRPADRTLAGTKLTEYLRCHRVTVLLCTRRVLETMTPDLNCLRVILISGESPSRDLTSRWTRPGRTLLHTYGAAEVTATTLTALMVPDRPPTLGSPLPGNAVVILDLEKPLALARGRMGEIGLAGAGLAKGYVNHQHLTDWAFIPDFLAIENNPSHRIYRSGDLGRINGDGEIEYHGPVGSRLRIDGHRVDLVEIESALLQVPGVRLAAVDTCEGEPGIVEIVGYYSPHDDARALSEQFIRERLGEQLPPHMVPHHLTQLRTPRSFGQAERHQPARRWDLRYLFTSSKGRHVG